MVQVSNKKGAGMVLKNTVSRMISLGGRGRTYALDLCPLPGSLL